MLTQKGLFAGMVVSKQVFKEPWGEVDSSKDYLDRE